MFRLLFPCYTVSGGDSILRSCYRDSSLSCTTRNNLWTLVLWNGHDNLYGKNVTRKCCTVCEVLTTIFLSWEIDCGNVSLYCLWFLIIVLHYRPLNISWCLVPLNTARATSRGVAVVVHLRRLVGGGENPIHSSAYCVAFDSWWSFLISSPHSKILEHHQQEGVDATCGDVIILWIIRRQHLLYFPRDSCLQKYPCYIRTDVFT